MMEETDVPDLTQGVRNPSIPASHGSYSLPRYHMVARSIRNSPWLVTNFIVFIVLAIFFSLHWKQVIPVVITAKSTYNTWSAQAQNAFHSECDIWKGRWVKDTTYPLYTETCPFIEEQFNCRRLKRTLIGYEQYRWQPDACTLPRFNATAMLQALRNQRMVFVGDSFTRQMYQSLLCLLWVGPGSDPSLPRPTERKGRAVQHAKRLEHLFSVYNATLSFTMSHTLAPRRSGASPAEGEGLPARLGKDEWVDVSALDKWTSEVERANVAVVHTGSWWSEHLLQRKHWKVFRAARGPGGGAAAQELTAHEGLRETMALVAKFVKENVSRETSYLQLGVPAYHFMKAEAKSFWGVPDLTRFASNESIYYDVNSAKWNRSGLCDWPRRPITDENALPRYDPRPSIVESNFPIGHNIGFLRIFEILAYRADAHIGKRSEPPQDCSHYCIPGAPDTWNELLFATLVGWGKVPISSP